MRERGSGKPVAGAPVYVSPGKGNFIEELVTDCVSGSMSGESLVRASAQLRVPARVATAQLRGALEAIANDLMVDLTLDDSGSS